MSHLRRIIIFAGKPDLMSVMPVIAAVALDEVDDTLEISEQTEI